MKQRAPHAQKGNQGPERRLREVGAQWSEVTDPLPHTCPHGKSQKERATVKLPLPFLAASSQNAKTITWPSSSACFPGRHSGQLAGKVEPQSPDSLSAPITRSNLGRACFSWSQEERLQTKTIGKFSPLTRRQLLLCAKGEAVGSTPAPLGLLGSSSPRPSTFQHLWESHHPPVAVADAPRTPVSFSHCDNPFRSPDTST